MYRVVIVDDEPMVRKSLAQYVAEEMPGFEVQAAFRTGTLAWQALENQPTDLLVTDIAMPGLSGLRLTELVAKRWPDTVVGIITGYSDFENARQAIALNVSSFLLKPLSMPDFRDSLEHMAKLWDDNQLRKAMESAAAQNPVDEFLGDLQQGGMADAAMLSARFKALNMPFPEERLRGVVFTLRTELQSGENSAADRLFAAISNVLRMKMQQYMICPISQRGVQITFLAMRSADQPAFDARLAASQVGEVLNREVALTEATAFDSLRQMRKLLDERAGRDGTRAARGSQAELVRNATAYIRAHLGEDVTLCRLANELHMNSVYVGRIFKRETGETFSDCLNRLRMQRAIEMLFDSYSIKTVYEAVGFSKSGSFSRAFKAFTSYTPSEYRRRVIRKEEA